MKKRILFYYFYLDGLGHIQRVRILANAIKERYPSSDVMVINGGRPNKWFEFSNDIELFQLPSLVSKKYPFFKLKPRALSISYNRVMKMRKEVLISLLKHYRPHVIITDFFPFERRFLSPEIIPMLQYAKETLKGCTIISSTREIMGMSRHIWNGRAKRIASQYVKKYYDYVFVHGDPMVFKLDEGLSLEVQKKIIYTGYLVCKKKNQMALKREMRKAYSAGRKILIVASAGGGIDGFCLLKNIIFTERILNKRKVLYKFLLFTGPNMHAANYNRLIKLAKMSRDLSVSKFSAENVDLMNASDISISMGGYNTCAEIMLTRVKSIIVPRVLNEKEQLIRSRRLCELNLASVIHPRNLTPQLLVSEITRVIAISRPRHNIDLNGAAFVATFLHR